MNSNFNFFADSSVVNNIGSIMLSAFKVLFDRDRKVNVMSKNREVATRLKFIGTLKSGQKVDPSNLTTENNTLLTPLRRMFFGISRDVVLKFFSDTIERTFEIVKATCGSNHVAEKIFCSNVINDLIKSTEGLKEQQITYDDDEMFKCELDTLIESIHGFLFEIQQDNPGIMTFKELHILELTKKDEDDDYKEDRRGSRSLLHAVPDIRTELDDVSNHQIRIGLP